MDIKNKKINAKGIKFYIKEGKKEVARAYLSLLKNDLHDQPFGLMEDVFVEESLTRTRHRIKTYWKGHRRSQEEKML